MTEQWVRGDWMQTFTGRQFYPLDPRPEDVDPVDIAHALSNLCRYAGHVDRFYSVAEHCVLVSRALERDGHPVDVQLEGLLHDATEAYVVDVPRPLKRSLPEYVAVEGRVAVAIAERFGHQRIVLSSDEPAAVIESPVVKEYDTRILLDERASLMSNTRHPWVIDGMARLGILIHAWAPMRAEYEYLKRLNELGVKDVTR